MSLVLGVLHLDMVVGDASSLKDKRRIIKSFLERTRSRHNVSVAEVGSQDIQRRSQLAVAMAGSDSSYVIAGLQKIAAAASMHKGVYVVSDEIEIL